MSLIPSAFSIDFDPDAEEQSPSVPMLTMHEFLEEIAEFIESNSSSEDIEYLQPEVIKRIANVLEARHKSGWSLESDYKQQLNQ
jgi:predicted house-cleaning noncanonical NTP pyrophosphatase (MazG superfamily)